MGNLLEVSSDDEGEESEPKRKIPKVMEYIETTVSKFDSQQYQFHFRTNKPTLYMLVG